ncbi:MAG: glutaredoxin family protein [Candidatus Lokiarchaeota archaeon]|nr:glutaredoxin family protein [Candidatus Lokiarchaeota archaeon]
MSSEIEFIHVLGNNKSRKVTLYALSTCGFCKRALAFLRENSIDFRYVFVDYLEKKVVGDLREELKEKSGRRHIVYPFLIVDDAPILVGFNEVNYKAFFNIE